MGKNPTIEMKIDILCSDTEHPEVKHIKGALRSGTHARIF